MTAATEEMTGINMTTFETLNSMLKYTVFFFVQLVMLAAIPLNAAQVELPTASPPAWAIHQRPADAPINVPKFDKIHAKVQQAGSVNVIVRFAAPRHLTLGWAEGTILSPEYVSDQLSAIQNAQDTILSRISSRSAATAKRFRHIPHMAVEVNESELSTLLNSPEIDYIEEDIPVPPTLVQSVPLIGADGSGTFSNFTGLDQTIAILDTGVDKTHPFLASKVVNEACFSTNSNGDAATTVCPNGQYSQIGFGAGVNCTVTGCTHGTHVAGIAAGNGGGFSGVAKNASVLAVQVFSRFDSAASCGTAPVPCVLSYPSDQARALDWVYTMRTTYNISSVNMSLGGGSYNSNCDAINVTLKNAIDKLRSVNIATIIASGNNGSASTITFPGCISTAVSVGATTKADAVANYSNSASIVNLLAPGSSIYSSVPGGGYASWDGTSMATPHVSGAWAVMKSKRSTATVDEVLNALIATGVPITDSRNGLVKPRINITNALNQISATPRTTASPRGFKYASAQNVTLSANEPATIYYTTDGTIPTTSSSVYTAPLTVSSTTTLKYFAMGLAGNIEAVKTQTYTIDPNCSFTINDARTALRAYYGMVSLSPEQKMRYDVAPLGTDGLPIGNGVVGYDDATTILNRALGDGTWCM